MTWQTVNFNVLLRMCTPEALKKSRAMAFFDLFFAPLTAIKERTLYKMQHDSRVIYIEKFLNEHLGVVTYDSMNHIATRQIYIVDAPSDPKTYIYQPEENNPIYLGSIYLNPDTGIDYQFIIKIPEDVVFNETRLRAEIDKYKLAGKRYIIETY